MNIKDIVVDKTSLGTVIGKTTDGRWVVEWTDGEIDPCNEENLFLIESPEDDPEVPMS